MRYLLSLDVIEDESSYPYLDAILLKVEDEWHLLDFQGDPDDLRCSSWYKQLTYGRQEFVDASLGVADRQRRRVSGPHLRHITVRLQPSAAEELTPKVARRSAEEPLVVVVENRFSDGAGFLDRIAEKLAPELVEFEDRRAIKKDSGGGYGEVPKVVRQHVDAATAQGFSARVVALFDSDARFPGDTAKPATESSAKRQQAETLGAEAVRLPRRSIENYLPDEVLDSWAGPGSQAYVQALKDLSAEERRFFPLRKGAVKIIEADEQAWYAAGSGWPLSLDLQSGPGRKALDKCFEQQHWQAVTPVDYAWFVGAELDQLLDSILDLL